MNAAMTTKEVIAVQYLRGIAAMLVVVDHLASSDPNGAFLPVWGQFGVAIFFVISGFIMWHTTVAADISVMEFWRRRIIRIVPLYWICLCCLVTVALLTPQALRSTVITPENTIKSFLFIPQFHAVQKYLIAPILIPGWSLNYEMFFYLLFGLSLLLRPPLHRVIALTVLLLALVVLGLMTQPTGAVMSTYTNYRLLSFSGGIILGILYSRGWLSDTTSGLVFISLGFLLKFLPDSSSLAALDTFIGVSPMLIVAGALALESAARQAPNSMFHTIGNASYSIYLSHLFFLRIAELGWQRLLPFNTSEFLELVFVVVAFTFAIVGGISVYHFVERPILSLFRRRRPSMLRRAI